MSLGEIFSKIINYLNPLLWFHYLIDVIKDLYYWIMQEFVDFLTFLINSVTFPPIEIPTLSGFSRPVSIILGCINWMMPISFLSTCFQMLIISTVAYFTIGILMRWLKVVPG